MRSAALVLLVVCSVTLPAQEPTSLRAVVVVAERTATPMNLSTAAVTRLTSADLERFPGATLADVLRRVPGFAVVDFDGSGRDPQLMVRGFYGGGEAEYVQVIVDGRVVNQVHNGTITWETLPPVSSIESIEIVRGSASALHGDAAVAGVINVVTRRSPRAAAKAQLTAESFEGIAGAVDLSGELGPGRREYTLAAGADVSNGFRDHAARASGSMRGALRFTRTLRAMLSVGVRDFDEPGPLLASRRVDGSESDPRFSEDGGTDREFAASVDHDGVLGAGGTLRSGVRLGGRRADLTRTLPLSPDFGDTRERELRTYQAGMTTQADLTPTILPPGIDRFTVGLNADLGTLDSRYYSGPAGDRNEDSRGDGRRATLGAFAHLVASTADRLRWNFGVRADWLNDSFEEHRPAREQPFSADNTHFAFSPRMGVNVRYASSGRAWFSASRTFKAPTFDQQFDRRPVPVPFPPGEITTSNPDLEPQRGTSAEFGLYHDVAISSASLGITATLYEITMRNELDFDVQRLRYVNIARSRHRGAELGATWNQGITSAFASISFQHAISRAGAHEGKQLKAVPGRVASAGMTVSPAGLATASASVTHLADMFIDDANTQRIPAWTRVDVQLSRAFGVVTAVLGARNLLDDEINSTAFLDPGGTGAVYYYPAAGRVVTLGLRYGR